MELPEVRNRRVDLLGEAADGRLVHIELQSTHDAAMALRMMEYCAAVCRQFGRFPEQVVLCVGEAPLRMTGVLSGPTFSFECRIADGDPAERANALTGLLILAGLEPVGRSNRAGGESNADIGRHHGSPGSRTRVQARPGTGAHDGELAMLLRQIEKRFGSVPSPVRDRLANMSVSEVESAALRLLDARSVEELLG